MDGRMPLTTLMMLSVPMSRDSCSKVILFCNPWQRSGQVSCATQFNVRVHATQFNIRVHATQLRSECLLPSFNVRECMLPSLTSEYVLPSLMSDCMPPSLTSECMLPSLMLGCMLPSLTSECMPRCRSKDKTFCNKHQWPQTYQPQWHWPQWHWPQSCRPQSFWMSLMPPQFKARVHVQRAVARWSSSITNTNSHSHTGSFSCHSV